MLEISKKVFALFNDRNVAYCSWKGNDHIAQCLSGVGDIDVLVSQNSRLLCYSILQELNFLQCKSQFGYAIPNVEDWLGFDKLSGKMIHIHLHFSMVAGIAGLMEYDLPWNATVLETRLLHQETGVYVIRPELELITRYALISLSAKTLSIIRYRFNGYQLPEKYLKEINYLKSLCDLALFRRYVNDLISYKPNRFVDLVYKRNLTFNDFSELRCICKKSSKKASRYSFLSKHIKIICNFIAMKCRLAIKKMSPYGIITRKTPMLSRPPIIAFMGQDGAGKSTVVKDIQKWLSWKLEVSQFYLGSGDHYNPWEKKLANHLHGSCNPIAKLIRKWLPFRYLSKLGKNVYETIAKANRYAAKGGIVLFDRYPQIEYVGINDGPKIRAIIMQHAKNGLTRAIANLYASKEEKYLQKAVAYSPDIVIKLMLSPEESIRRKPHENYEMVKKKHEIIKSLKFKKAKVYIVDATQNYENELIEIKNIIWNNIQK